MAAFTKLHLSGLLSSVLLMCPTYTLASIVPSGDYSPVYNWVDDPWDVGGDLTIGDTGTGSMFVNLGSGLVNENGYIGKSAGSSGTLLVLGQGTTWDQSGYLYVGYEGEGLIDIYDGATASTANCYVGYEAGSVGEAAVGPGGTLSTHTLAIGWKGDGTLTVMEGGSVTSGAARLASNHFFGSVSESGTATINGNGSTWGVGWDMRIGDTGVGTLQIENGGLVQVGMTTHVAARSFNQSKIMFSNGTLETTSLFAAANSLPGVGVIEAQGLVSDVDIVIDSSSGLSPQIILNNLPGQNVTINLDLSGVNEFSTQSELGVGYAGAGSLIIRDGYEVDSIGGYLGYHAGSDGDATVSGVGSRWYAADIGIGIGGTGSLTIEDGGGVASIGHNYIGQYAGSHGTVTVTGPGSYWQSAYRLSVGAEGTGVLNIENGGLVEGAWELYITEQDGGVGTVNLTGGTLRMDHGWISDGGGTAVFNFLGGRLEGASSIDLSQPLVQHGGTLAPSVYGVQTTTIYDAYILAAGTVEIAIGDSGNKHDRIRVNDDIGIGLFGTTLDLIARGPMGAGTYTVIETTGGTLTGEFEHVTGIGMYAGLVDVAYTSSAVTITLNWDYLPGDLDGDGFVGITDLNLILGNWNLSVAPADLFAGDVSGDGFVGIEDLNAVLGNWNSGTPPMTVVPEPGALALVAVGAGMGVLPRRRIHGGARGRG